MSDLTPERITILRSMHGDMSMSSDGKPLQDDIGDRHIEYVRADLHDALRAEVERLKNLATREVFKRDEMLGRLNAAEADAAAAREQVRKMREALEHFARIGRDMPPSTDMVQIGIEHFRRVARAALQGEGER